MSAHMSSVQKGPKGWLFDIGEDNYTTQLYGDYFISQFFRIPINQSVFQWNVSQGF